MDLNQTEECVYLMGRPPISEYLKFIQTQTYDSHNVDSSYLTEEWLSANDRVKEVEKMEDGFADNHASSPIPDNLKLLVDEVKNNNSFKKAYGFMPYHFAMVELDKLMVYQKYINLTHVERIKEELKKDLSDETIFKRCFPSDSQRANIRHQQVGSQAYHFVSESSDLRILDTMLLNKDQIQGYIPNGVVAGIVGVVVGFGTNYLSAISVDNRLILNNGSHRAYALRDLGVTHVPCVIQVANRVEELELFGHHIVQVVQQYHDNGRPPLLKDYFDSRLRKIVQLSRKQRHIQVNFNVNVSDLPI